MVVLDLFLVSSLVQSFFCVRQYYLFYFMLSFMINVFFIWMACAVIYLRSCVLCCSLYVVACIVLMYWKEQQLSELVSNSGNSSEQLAHLNNELRVRDRSISCLIYWYFIHRKELFISSFWQRMQQFERLFWLNQFFHPVLRIKLQYLYQKYMHVAFEKVLTSMGFLLKFAQVRSSSSLFTNFANSSQIKTWTIHHQPLLFVRTSWLSFLINCWIIYRSKPSWAGTFAAVSICSC